MGDQHIIMYDRVIEKLSPFDLHILSGESTLLVKTYLKFVHVY